MLDQFKGMQDDLQKKLNGIMVTGESGGGRVKILANANQVVTNITIVDSLLTPENAEELEDLLITAFNRVTEEAKIKAGEEAKNAMSSILPPGMELPGFLG